MPSGYLLVAGLLIATGLLIAAALWVAARLLGPGGLPERLLRPVPPLRLLLTAPGRRVLLLGPVLLRHANTVTVGAGRSEPPGGSRSLGGQRSKRHPMR